VQEDIKQRLEQSFPNGQIALQFDGNRLTVQIISDKFEGMSRVKRQQSVYVCLNEYIQSGELHAVSITAKTFAEHES